MDPDLENVIRQALADAKAVGKDYLSQTEGAVRTVRQARPDLTALDALVAVDLVRMPGFLSVGLQDAAVDPTYSDKPYISSFSINHFGRKPSSYCLP